MASCTATRGNNCNDAETYALLDQWADKTIQAELEGTRNQAVYEITRYLREHEVERSANQCRDKIRKLKGTYKKASDNNGKTGTGRAVWKFFDIMDRILGHRPASQAQH